VESRVRRQPAERGPGARGRAARARSPRHDPEGARGAVRRRHDARWHLARGLGGNVSGWPRGEVNRWRAKYVDERARIGVFGFGAYHFRFENSSEQVMRDTIAGLARGLGKA